MKILVVAVTLSLVSFSASAKMAYLTKFKSTYPKSETSKISCKICHVGSGYGETNDYSKDYAANKYDYKAIEALDSDVDGFSNIIEINAGTHPGNRDSHPAQ